MQLLVKSQIQEKEMDKEILLKFNKIEMDLTKKEKTEILTIMDKFTKVHRDIEVLETELSRIEHKRTGLIKELKFIREEETTLVESLQNKYGAHASLDLETLEIIET